MVVAEDRDIALLVEACEMLLPLDDTTMGREFRYRSLPFAVLDAVFSIGVRYRQVENVVARYARHDGLERYRPRLDVNMPRRRQLSISSFLDGAGPANGEVLATLVRNRGRTSPRNGILKAEAAIAFARILEDHGVEHFQDVRILIGDVGIEAGIRQIPGQRSGVSFDYFMMLAGSSEHIKPDRMVLGFLANALRRKVEQPEAKRLVITASRALRRSHPCMTPRLLDYRIWSYQREQPRG